MKFEPANTYEDLLTQARALARIVTAKEGVESHLRKIIKELEVEKYLTGLEEISSLRSVNEQLTNELEEANKRIEQLEEYLQSAYEQIESYFN